eukprot:CAMPEP_0119149650 /NCGR_PEP_ID=MMETSP1310-20130426/43664_1 /TAXON_ID=464262 /ORGANISM="Genus nov. species nov., Strain RCC2339" /LENGTH=163 /DNA_ID=CAMNT_0007141773 /DNA_START=31 /DNA_END=518 /DNA_ORIENTATION=-
MGDDDNSLREGPLENRLTGSKWKMRMYAYEELEKAYRNEVDGEAPLYTKFAKSLPAFIADKNAPAQEKALDLVLAFLDRAECAKKYAPPMCGKLVEATLGQRSKNRDKGVEALALIVEIEAPVEPVVQALLEGSGNKNPKLATQAVKALVHLVQCFGARLFPL